MRGACLLGFALLGACSKGSSEPAPHEVPGAEKIACALGPGVGFKPDCAIERSQDGAVYKMIVRHPDGGFRRFEVGADNVIATADGSEAAGVTLTGAIAEVAVGDDRYRIPLEARAPIASDAAKP